MPQAFTSLTEAQMAEVETLAAVLSTQQMADYFGMGRTTFYSLMDREPEVAERYKRGRARAVGVVAQSLIAKARSGNVTAMIFFLKTQAGWRETDRHEVAVGPTINVVDSFGAASGDGLPGLDVSRLSDAALTEILSAYDGQTEDGPTGPGDDAVSAFQRLARRLDASARGMVTIDGEARDVGEGTP